MDIAVNGQTRAVDDAIDVTTLLALLGTPDRGVAVAVDGRVVARSAWDSTTLRPGAEVEVLTAVQGG